MVMSILVMVNGCHISGSHVNSHGHVNGDSLVNDHGLVMVNKGHVNGSVRYTIVKGSPYYRVRVLDSNSHNDLLFPVIVEYV